MPNQETQILQAILESPDDDALRLVYADLLEERGDPRASSFASRLNWLALPTTIRERRNFCADRTSCSRPTGTNGQGSCGPSTRLRSRLQFERGMLESLTIRNGSDQDLDILPRTSGLRRLHLHSCSLNEVGLRRISELDCLVSLSLGDTAIAEADLSLLEGLPCWTVVRMYHQDGRRLFDTATWQAFQNRHIAKFSQLDARERRRAAIWFLSVFDPRLAGSERVTSACLTQAGIGDAEVRLLSGLPELEEVRISESWDVTAAGIHHLGELPELTSLQLYDTGVNALTPLAGCPKLETLEVSRWEGGMGDEGTVGLERLSNLTTLVLRRPWHHGPNRAASWRSSKAPQTRLASDRVRAGRGGRLPRRTERA